MSKHLDTNMTEGSIFRQLLFFSLPLLAGNFFQQCYNTVDSIVLGNFVGKAALAADHAVVTSDNPRTEDPQAIIEDIVSGMSSGAGRFEVEADRRAAIARAIAQAKPGDSILIAGKGHEDYQLVGDQVLSFDDRIVAAEELARAFGDEPAGEDR